MVDARFDRRPGSPTGSGPKKSDAETEALGRSRGGFSSKVHVVTDALGNPLAFRVTAGQRHDITQAEPLLKTLSPTQRAEVEAVLADKGYDSNAFIDAIVALEAQAVIPSRKGRKEPRDYDVELYKERNLVERFFNRIKHYRRVATRYEKSVQNYVSFLHVASIMVWLR